MTNASYTANRNSAASSRLSTGESNVQKAKRILEQKRRSDAPVSPSRWRAGRSSASSLDLTHETTSTATTITEPSHEPQMESVMMRTRTNFGDYQYYVPPETKCSPYRVPTGSPVSPNRDPYSSPRSPQHRKAPERLNLPMLPVSPRREPREDRELDTFPSPLTDKRLQFFDDTLTDQLPFDQVWNQQEFSLDLDRDETDNQVDEEKPFDEHVPNKTGLPGSSAASAFTVRSNATATATISPPPPPPPPPPPASKFKAQASPTIRARAAALFQDSSEKRTPMKSSIMDMPERGGNYPKSYTATNDDNGDIPSDEDEVSLNRFDRSLATASKRKTAEEFGRKKVAEDLSSPGSLVRSDSDDKSVDSLFDFEKQRRTIRSPTPPRRRQDPRPNIETPIDDNSDEQEGVKSLKTRTQEAFATRKKHSPRKSPSPHPVAPRATASPLPRKTIAAVPSPMPDSQQEKNDVTALAPPSTPKVTFTTNTVHHFQQEYDMYSDNGESSAASIGTYEDNKSMGAEVEEALKDIFMLTACSPSPRQIRYHADTRFERRESEITNDFSDEEGSIAAQKSDDESAKPETDTGVAPKKKEEDEADIEEKLKNVDQKNDGEDIFFEAMMSMVEGGIGAMSAAFDFASSGFNAATKSRTTKDPSPKVQRTTPRGSVGRRSSPEDRARGSVMDSMSDYVLSSDKSESSDDLESIAPEDEREHDSKHEMASGDDDDDGPVFLDDDPRLLELAKQSAVCIHEILGVRYDLSRGVEINDVKFVVVVMMRPLGIIFQEDYSGCWVTKVLPKGNAEQKGIEAGDQLAAVNGRSAVGMKVDDICVAIGSISEEIELTFLRYIGPFRPVESDGASLTDGSQSMSTYPFENQPEEEEKPRSTMSISNHSNSKSSAQTSSTKKLKRGSSFRKKFKWFRGKKNLASKAE